MQRISQYLEWKKVRVIVQYAVYMIIALALQSMVFSRISIFGIKALVLPAAAVAVGFYLGGVKGAVFGIFLGLFADMNFAETTVMFTLLYPLIGFGAGVAREFFINKTYYSFVILSIIALAVTGFIQMLAAMIISGAQLWTSLLTLVLQTVISAIPAACFYLPFKNK